MTTIDEPAVPGSPAMDRVVVTGGARGIGAAIARRFADAGARVALIDVLAEQVNQTAAELAAVAVVGDLSDAADTRRATGAAIDLLGGVDVLVNNAGVFATAPLLEITSEQWDGMFAVNARAPMLTIQLAADAMIAAGRGGSIVNIASMGGKDGAAGQAHYAASKAALISLTQVAAKELGTHAIRVNALCPGYVLTEMGADSRSEAQIAEWSARSPLGRLGRPDDVASFALFLATDDASYLTGQAFNVTGGMITH